MQVILVAHSGLASAFRQAAMALLGPTAQLEAFDLAEGDSPARLGVALEASLDLSQLTIIMVDLFGGTPWQVAIRLAAQAVWRDRIAVISGLNLAMVLEGFLSPASEPLPECVKRIYGLAGESIRTWPEYN